MVEIIQSDRQLYSWLFNVLQSEIDAFNNGAFDAANEMQAIARHRIASAPNQEQRRSK